MQAHSSVNEGQLCASQRISFTVDDENVAAAKLTPLVDLSYKDIEAIEVDGFSDS